MTIGMILPGAVDLRSSIDNVYYQGPSNKCVAYSTKGAIETALDRSSTHVGIRVSADYIYARGKFRGNSVGDVGLHPSFVQSALQADGVSLDWQDNGDYYTQPDSATIAQARLFGVAKLASLPYYNNDIVVSIKRSLAFGIPVVVVMNLCRAFDYIPSGSWKTMDWDASGVTYGEHAVLVVGYDDSVGRFLIENSWGSWYGDGGFYGFPYDKFTNGLQRCVTTHWRFEALPVDSVSVSGFTPGVPELTGNESSDFYQRAKPLFRSLLDSAVLQGVQALLDKTIELGLSDKLLEDVMQWPRFFVTQTLAANPGYNSSGLFIAPSTGYQFILGSDCIGLVQRNKAYSQSRLINTINTQGLQAFVNEMSILGLSDKHVEYLGDFQRKTVRDFIKANNLAYNGLVLDQL